MIPLTLDVGENRRKAGEGCPGLYQRYIASLNSSIAPGIKSWLILV